MRSALVVVLLGLTGCTALDEQPEPHAQKREAMFDPFDLGDAGPSRKGRLPQGHLGSAIAACPGSGFLAGAPGVDLALFIPQDVEVSSLRGSVTPYSLVCAGTGTGLRGFVAGTPPMRVLIDGGFNSVGNVGVESLALSTYPESRGWLLVGSSSAGQVSVHVPNAINFNGAMFTTAPLAGRGAAVAWHPNGIVFSNSDTQQVARWAISITADGGVSAPTAYAFIQNPDLSHLDFGSVLAVGNVAPVAGEEIIVGAPESGFVYVYSEAGSLVMTLQGLPGFGSALLVDPREFGGRLHALWVGQPRLDVVSYFIGDAGTPFKGPASATNGSFGAALAIDPMGTLAVGAPDYSLDAGTGEGAVYLFPTDGGLLPGAAGTCNGTCVLPGCNVGTCVGGVFCMTVLTGNAACGAGQVCSNGACIPFLPSDAGVDAGAPDAGGRDAGPVDDAGIVDAGVPVTRDAGFTDAGFTDAGSTDAGPAQPDSPPIVFTSCGCSTSGFPTLLLVLALGLWRRRA